MIWYSMYTEKERNQRRSGGVEEKDMRVVEVETQDQKVRYVVVDEEGKLVGPIVHYLKYLDRLGSARQTLRSYAAALRLYWEFLSQEQFDFPFVC